MLISWFGAVFQEMWFVSRLKACVSSAMAFLDGCSSCYVCRLTVRLFLLRLFGLSWSVFRACHSVGFGRVVVEGLGVVLAGHEVAVLARSRPSLRVCVYVLLHREFLVWCALSGSDRATRTPGVGRRCGGRAPLLVVSAVELLKFWCVVYLSSQYCLVGRCLSATPCLCRLAQWSVAWRFVD